MSDIRSALEQKLTERSAKVAILGQGYVGLPLAVVFAEAGFEVTGIDPDTRKVAAIHAGESTRSTPTKPLLASCPAKIWPA